MPPLRQIQHIAATAAGTAILLLTGNPAVAATARSELGVGARVVSTCTVSSDANSVALAPSCNRETHPSITTERSIALMNVPRPQRATVGENREAAASTTSTVITFVTVKY